MESEVIEQPRIMVVTKETVPVTSEQDDLDKERARLCLAKMILKEAQKKLGKAEKALDYKQRKLLETSRFSILDFLKESDILPKYDEE